MGAGVEKEHTNPCLKIGLTGRRVMYLTFWDSSLRRALEKLIDSHSQVFCWVKITQLR